MFERRWLERLSVAHPFMPFIVYAPAGVWLLWRAVKSGFHPLTVAVLYVCGLLIWSLVEYGTHRGSFHHTPTTQGQLAYAYLVHGVHHAYPDDARRWVIPLAASLPITIALFVAFMLLFGVFGRPLFGGFLHGYLTYDLLHYFIHRGRLPTRAGRYLRQYHLTHHYAKPDRHFGVSSPLWDLVFRTK
jgi:sterol desaturase/sphingolipid hydroxylase (fatty acid hydroxylase superfamily)